MPGATSDKIADEGVDAPLSRVERPELGDSGVEGSTKPSHSAGIISWRMLSAFAAIIVITMVVLAFVWSSEPGTFSVQVRTEAETNLKAS
ncbi:MAG: hypothetical protein ACI9DC_005534, partial [Gammaproteobacteria bacterium]